MNAHDEPRKRRRSIVRPEIQNPGAAATRERCEATEHAFRTVLQSYVNAIEHSDPIGYSSLAQLDETARCVKRRDVEDVLIDVSMAVTAALEDDSSSVAKFYAWFVTPEIEPGVDWPFLEGDAAKLYERIIQTCGREFERRGIFPLRKYFGLHERERIVA